MPPRSGDAAHIREGADLRGAERLEELLEWARAVTDRPDATHRVHCHSGRVSDVAVRPVSPDQHDAVMHFFDLVAYADNPNWSKCFCMERLVTDYDERTKAQNRAARSELIKTAKANGLVAYRLGRVVGWCHAAPKSELVDVPGERTGDVGAVVCFVVAPDQRRQGIATTLLEAALDQLRTRGLRTVEAYPWLGEVDAARWVWTQYVGPLSMYEKAGFRVVEKHDDFCIVRPEL